MILGAQKNMLRQNYHFRGVAITVFTLAIYTSKFIHITCFHEGVEIISTLPAFHGHAGNISVNYSVYGYVESNGRH